MIFQKPLVNFAGGFCFIFVLSCLSGCATVSLINPRIAADRISASAHLSKTVVSTDYFQLTSFYRISAVGQPLNIYIEGDGAAWITKYQISQDPTPYHPVALLLAAQDTSPNVVYLARPCQYSWDSHCSSDYWSNKRYSEEVVASTNQAVDFFVRESKSDKINLIGYSGGGAVAVLIAQRRGNIMSLRTVAGNLDPSAVNQYYHVDSLEGSLDPMNLAQNLKNLPQRHFVGGADKIVPAFIVKNFQAKMPDSACFHVTEIQNATHSAGWKERWPQLLALPVTCDE